MNQTTQEQAQMYQQIKKRADRYNDRTLAFKAAARGHKTRWVMLGDDGKFWVVRPVDAARLERMGLEYAD